MGPVEIGNLTGSTEFEFYVVWYPTSWVFASHIKVWWFHPLAPAILRLRRPDQGDLWSDHHRAHACSRCARITWSGKGFERTFCLDNSLELVWSEVTFFCDVWPEAVLTAHQTEQRPIWAYTSLIRGRFKQFFKVLFLLKDVVSVKS